MTDLVERLQFLARKASPWPEDTVQWQAAILIEQLRAENARMREALADMANTINIVGSNYDQAITALDAMMCDVKSRARKALGDHP